MVKLNLHKIQIAAAMIAADAAMIAVDATPAAQQDAIAADAMIAADVATAVDALMTAAAQEEVAYHNGVSGLKVVSHLTNPPSMRSQKKLRVGKFF